MTAITLDLNPVATLSHEQFLQLCQTNPDLKLERTAQGELVVMPPTGGETGRINFDMNLQLGLWNRKYKLGQCFDSSTGFILPNGATRSPDMSWVEQSRWEALRPEQREKYLPLCPDFVVELMSPSDVVYQTRAKLQEYMDNCCRLGWLINRGDRQVEIYRQGQAVETLEAPNTLSGEDILTDFELELAEFW